MTLSIGYNGWKIRLLDIWSFIVFFACVEVPYIIRVFHGQRHLFFLRCMILIVLCVLYIRKNKRIDGVRLVVVWICTLIISTYLSGHDVKYAIQILSIPVLMAFYLNFVKKEMDRVLFIWERLLLLLVIIDFFSIILFPEGLYNDGLQSLNWFLGYKTARFALELPLCMLVGYRMKKYKGKFGIKTYICIILSLFCTFYSKATASFVCTILLGGMFFVFDCATKIKKGKHFFYNILNYKIILSVYLLLVVAVFNIQKVGIIQFVVVNVFKKTPTLTTRTYIWDAMFEKILQRLLCGYGVLNQETYVSITLNPYANSAHNMVLAILMAGGCVGLFIYMMIFFVSLRRNKNIYEEYELPIVAGIIIMLIIGITSESLTYCEFSLIPYVIMNACKCKRNIVNEMFLGEENN